MKKAKAGAPCVLQVGQGVVVPPEVLQTLLPSLASIVKDAISQPSTSKPQDTDNRYKPRHQINILNPFPCNICKLRFPSRPTLNSHILSHEYECHHCKKPFDNKKLLLKHSCTFKIWRFFKKPKINANHKNCTKVFSCKCGEGFSSKSDFITHQKNHVEKYGNSDDEIDLIDHVSKMKTPGTCLPNVDKLLAPDTAHREPPKYTCKVCNETFEDSFAATSHSRSHGAPLRSYSRKPKKKIVTNANNIVNDVVKEERLNERSDLYKEFEPEGSINRTLEEYNDERLIAAVKEESSDQRFDEDLEDRVLKVTEPKPECVKMEFEVDEEMIESNQKELDIGIPSNLSTQIEDVKDVALREIMKETNEKELDVIVMEKIKHLQCVKVENEDMREAIETVDSDLTSNHFKLEVEFREDIKKEPNESGIELSNSKSDEDMYEVHDVKPLPYELSPEARALYRGHLVTDELVVGPVWVQTPIVYSGRNAFRSEITSKQEPSSTIQPCTGKVLEPCLELKPAEIPEERRELVDKPCLASIKYSLY